MNTTTKAQRENRQEKIDAGKIWQAYPDNDPDRVLFEGSKTKCREFQRYAKGNIRIGRLLWETSPQT